MSSLSSTQVTPQAKSYVVCDPQGRTLRTTLGSDKSSCCAQFSQVYEMTWQTAEKQGYEVFELKPTLQQEVPAFHS